MREPRSDAWWRDLSQERREQIAGWCRAKKTEDSPGGVQFAREQLAADGIKVSLSQVSRFFAFWRTREEFTGAANICEAVKEAVRAEFPNASAEKLAAVGQIGFLARAIAEQSQEKYVQLQQLDLDQRSAETRAKFKREEIDLKRTQFEMEIAEKMLDEALLRKAQEIAGSGMSQAAKIAAMRKAAFADVDALEASGKIEIPRDETRTSK
jgi:DNA uptake protein ComE-like DNA-binding protein